MCVHVPVEMHTLHKLPHCNCAQYKRLGFREKLHSEFLCLRAIND